MKKLMITAFLLCFACSSAVFGEELSSAKITGLSGLVEVSRPDENKKQNWAPAGLGQVLNQGDELRTKEGRVELTFEDGSKLNLKENTALTLFKMQDKNRKGDTLVKLWIGQIKAKFTVQKDDSTFQVQTKNIIAAVKGTEFIVDADLNGGFLKVLQGIVALIDALYQK